MTTISSFVEGSFLSSGGEEVCLLDPATEEVVGAARCGGVDFAAALAFARERGLPAQQGLTFAERGELLGRMAARIHEQRDALIETSVVNGGSTRSGAKFDVDGASATLAAYAEIGKELGATMVLPDGDSVALGRSAKLHGRHYHVSRPGVAVFINAFNFPAWGFAEKAACALLAGMPVVNKPATLTSLTAGRLAEILVEADILPPGVFTQVLGPVTGLLEQLGAHDVVAFTGSSDTAALVRATPNLVAHSVHVNVEADSLNAAVLAPTDPGGGAYQAFLRDVVREMTEKTGQKCTATRRLIVPQELVDTVAADLAERLGSLKIGNPRRKEVEMGPLATRPQMQDVHAGAERLAASAEKLLGESRPADLIEVPEGKGFFCGPMLFVARGEEGLAAVHEAEVFGPVSTILPYSGEPAEAVGLVRRGGGSLVSTIYGDDRGFTRAAVAGIAPFVGRLCLVDSKSEGYTLPPGMVLPQLLHGGPGRAGGGEELAGIRGVQRLMIRTALQGSRGLVERVLG